MILHKFSTSPFDSSRLQTHLKYVAEQDGILLCEDAVYLVQHHLARSLGKGSNQVYLLKEDMIARGLTQSQARFKQVDYAEFVALSLEYEKVVSW